MECPLPDEANTQSPSPSVATNGMRSFLFISSLSTRAFEHASVRAADCLILDMVGGSGKSIEQLPTLLNCLTTEISHRSLFARVNHPDTGQTENDLSHVMPSKPNGIVLSSVVGYNDVARLAAMLAVAEAEYGLEQGSTRILAVAGDSSAGIMALSSFATAQGPARRRLAGLAWDSRALLAEIGAASNARLSSDLISLARSMTLIAARAARVQAIDSCCYDADVLEQECRDGAAAGFDGKLAVEPSHIESINEIFSVTN